MHRSRWRISSLGRKSLRQEERTDVPVKKIAGNIRSDHRLECLEHSGVVFPKASGDFEADMQELPNVRIEFRAFGIVTQRGDVFVRGPLRDLGWKRKLGEIDIDHRGVGLAKLFPLFVCLCVDLAGK